MTHILGKSPISPPILIVGKLAFLGSFLFFLVKNFGLAPMLYDSPLTQTLGIVLAIAGLVMVLVGIRHLGKSVAVGLPETETELKTRGIYSITRNPMYLGGFLICGGSCLYALHVVNFLLSAVAVLTHVPIVKREEEFLAKRFGQKWLDYERRVPRFFGPVHRS